MNPPPSYLDDHIPVPGMKLAQKPFFYVGDQVAKLVDMDDVPGNLVFSHFRLRNIHVIELGGSYSHIHRLYTNTQMGCYRSKYIPAMKGAADILQEITRIVDFPYLFRLMTIDDLGNHPIVGKKKIVTGSLHQLDLPAASHARIHHDHMNGTGRKVTKRIVYQMSSPPDILGGYMMRQVHHRNHGIDAFDHPFHQTDIFIPQPKIRGKGYHGIRIGFHHLTSILFTRDHTTGLSFIASHAVISNA